MLGLRALVVPCARTRLSAWTASEPCAKMLQARMFTTAKQPVAVRHPLLAPRAVVGGGLAKAPITPVRAYRGVYRPQPTVVVPQAQPLSQKLWQVAGVGAICGLGVVALDGLRASADKNAFQGYVSERVTKTYGYVVASLGLTAGFATYIVRSGMHYRLAMANPWLMLGATVAGTAASMMAVLKVEDKPLQHAAWLAFTGFMGLSIFPVAFMGGALVQRAIIGTAAIVGSISLVAATTRSDAHFAMAGPLSVGLGVVFAASIGQLFLPASPLLYNVVVYGGLAVFGGFTYFDTQRMIHNAKYKPKYDPLKASVGIYLDVIQIFWRMVSILSGGQRKK